MSVLSSITGSDARKRKTQAESEKAYGGNVGTQYLQGMHNEAGMAGNFENERVADRTALLGTLDGGQGALEASTKAALSAAMPTLFNALQHTKENNIRRGMMNGETPTSYEGDVYSAFQGNLANATAGQAMNMFGTQVNARQGMMNMSAGLGERSRGTYYDLMAGKLDRDQVKRNAKAQTQQGYLNTAVDLVGAVAGGKGRKAGGG